MTSHQGPVAPTVDLRDMLRQYVIARSLGYMNAAAERRRTNLRSGELAAYRAAIRGAVAGFYAPPPSTGGSSSSTLSRPPAQDAARLPFGPSAPPVASREVSRFERAGYRLENVLFDSFAGWEVNATVYVPLDYAPPFPAVIIPVGHSGKQFASYQLPAQYFASAGYLAVLFDPPGQAGEKQAGNDHFTDGVRGYLVGQTSSRYFVGDALRCVDYVTSRSDVDARRGVAMTGVSGGGTTTTLATLLDERITVAGPSCCVTPLADLDITQCYAGCPETHMARRYAEGVDEVDLVAAACPTPVLLMAGARDEVFHIADTRRLADEVAAFYAQAGAGERFAFYEDDGGHGYSLAQAREFTRFMDRWLRGAPGELNHRRSPHPQMRTDAPLADTVPHLSMLHSSIQAVPERELPGVDETQYALDPDDMLRCHPRQDVNMRTLALARADELAAARATSQTPAHVLAAALHIAQTGAPANLQSAICNLPPVTAHEPFQVWTHDWQQLLLTPEPGIELPATLLLPRDRGPAPAILHFDDAGRNRLLYRNGLLARAAGFIERDGPLAAVLSVDLRGWGDTAPTVYPYEMAGWGSLDRYFAYATAALGDPVLAMRVRDGLAGLAYLRTRPEIDPADIVVTGCGLGGIVALHVAAASAHAGTPLAGVVTWDSLASFRDLLAAEYYRWPADAFLPNVLLYYDLLELIAALPCPATVFNPRDGAGALLSVERADALNADLPSAAYRAEVGDREIVEALRHAMQRVLLSE